MLVQCSLVLKPYPMSPRNTASAIIKLLKDTSCHRILTTYQTLGTLIDQIKTELASTDPTYDLTIDEVPLLSDIFPKLGHEKLPDLFEEYPTGRRAGLDEVLMYLHSSGSTGLPKTVPQTFRSMVHWAALRASPIPFCSPNKKTYTYTLYSARYR